MLKEEELLNIKGGAINATLVNALARIIGVFYDIGEAVGSSIRRITSKNRCKVS
jgi:hypothetical protein